MNSKAGILTVLAILTLSQCVCGQCPGSNLNATLKTMTDAQSMLTTIGYPIGFIMMLYMAAKWIMAESPEDRENARRGVIYVVVGLIILRTANDAVIFLLC